MEYENVTSSVGHDQPTIEIHLSKMLHRALDVPDWQFFKKWRLVREARKYAKAHKKCCQLDYDF